MGMTMIPDGSGGFTYIPTANEPRQPDYLNCPKCEGKILQFTCPCCQKTIQVDDIEEESSGSEAMTVLFIIGTIGVFVILVVAGANMALSQDPDATFFGEVWKVLVSIGTFFTRLW